MLTQAEYCSRRWSSGCLGSARLTPPWQVDTGSARIGTTFSDFLNLKETKQIRQPSNLGRVWSLLYLTEETMSWVWRPRDMRSRQSGSISCHSWSSLWHTCSCLGPRQGCLYPRSPGTKEQVWRIFDDFTCLKALTLPSHSVTFLIGLTAPSVTSCCGW